MDTVERDKLVAMSRRRMTVAATMTAAAMTIAVGILAILPACFSPQIPEGISCGLNGVCPDGQGCFEGICRKAPGAGPDECLEFPERCCNPEEDFQCADAGAPGGVSFQAPVDLSIGQLPSEIISGDVTGDGHLDLLVSHSEDTQPRGVIVFAGDGAGGFNPVQEFIVGNAAFGLVIVDINQDGLQGFAWLAREGTDFNSPQSIAMVQQVAPGELGAVETFAIPAPNNQALDPWVYLHHADVNGDGRGDLVFQDTGVDSGIDGTYGYLPQHPTIEGQYDAALEFQAVRSDGKSHLSDLNRDGFIDVISIGQSGIRYAQQSSSAPGTFGPGFLLLAESGFQLIAKDINADGALDLTTVAGGGVWTILQDSDNVATFLGPVSDFGIGGGGDRFTGTDLNGDGRMDIFFSFGGSLLAEPPVYGTFVPGPMLEFSDGADITAGDFNGDGKPDVAILHRGDPQFETNGFVRVHLQN